MAASHRGQSDQWENALTTLNDAFTYVFVVEAALKLVAFSPQFYFQEGWNTFDLCASFSRSLEPCAGRACQTRRSLHRASLRPLSLP